MKKSLHVIAAAGVLALGINTAHAGKDKKFNVLLMSGAANGDVEKVEDAINNGATAITPALEIAEYNNDEFNSHDDVVEVLKAEQRAQDDDRMTWEVEQGKTPSTPTRRHIGSID